MLDIYVCLKEAQFAFFGCSGVCNLIPLLCHQLWQMDIQGELFRAGGGWDRPTKGPERVRGWGSPLRSLRAEGAVANNPYELVVEYGETQIAEYP